RSPADTNHEDHDAIGPAPATRHPLPTANLHPPSRPSTRPADANHDRPPHWSDGLQSRRSN
ncbi:hypothetical protein, partial [Micromonospora sp. KC606]|uniref:hypothetical protein n=1 Tax=Micromonospora sp. KC606 TaxID=2530379 RepID=UPI001A9EE87A